VKTLIHRTFFVLLLTLTCLLFARAQSSTEELGEKLFTFFQNRSADFSPLLPAMDQIQEKVKAITDVPLQNRLEAFSTEYPASIKRFNELCNGILENGKESGINWKKIRLKSIQSYPQNISISYADTFEMVKFTKLSIYFTYHHRTFILIADAVMDFNGQYLISDDLLEFSEMATNKWYQH
jgi:hypothetical protein